MPPPELGIAHQADIQIYQPDIVTEAEKIIGSRLRKTSKQTPTREGKRKKHRERKLQVPFDHDKRNYVVDGYGTPQTMEYDGEILEGLLFTTVEQGDWFLAFPEQQRIPLVETPFHLNGASDELGRRQKPERAEDKHGKDHERNLLFFDANWEVISPLFFDTEVPMQTRLQRYREVDLNDFALEREGQEGTPSKGLLKCGIIDFIGVAPDGQVLVVEFGDSQNRKSRQLAKQTKGLKEIIRDKNHGIVPNIIPYIGVYDDKADPFVVRFEVPDSDYFPQWYVSPHPEVVLYERPLRWTT